MTGPCDGNMMRKSMRFVRRMGNPGIQYVKVIWSEHAGEDKGKRVLRDIMHELNFLGISKSYIANCSE